jgi:hypothetical protein
LSFFDGDFLVGFDLVDLIDLVDFCVGFAIRLA